MKNPDQSAMENQIELLLGNAGILSQHLPAFRFRSQQKLLAENIAAALADDGFLLAEAGTGIGKTFAYLIPAITWCQQTKNKVVVSTRTKALQQQITEDDLPALLRIMNSRIKTAEAKGRDNYLCWNKYQQILAGKKALSAAEQDFVQAILVWAERTKSGDRKELELPSEMMQSWPVLAADRTSCLRDQCRYQDKCFRQKMIRNVHKADLIIVNHALLLSDILIENREKSILPDYEYLIIDEAHTFIKESFEQLSYRFSSYENKRVLGALHEKARGKVRRGYLLHLLSAHPHLSALITEATTYADQSQRWIDEFFNSLNDIAVYSDNYAYHHVIKPGELNQPALQRADRAFREWRREIRLLIDKLTETRDEIASEDDFLELSGLINALTELGIVASIIMEDNLLDPQAICWLEYEKGRVSSICSSPIYTGDSLDEKLYRKLNGLVMLSATMTVDNNFDNYINRSGLRWYEQDGRLNTMIETSPFDYENNAALYIVEDMPDPGNTRFFTELQRVLTEIVLLSRGRTMVLFTARKQMEETAACLRPLLEANDIKLLVQYQDGEFASLMDGFKSHANAVLMGLETFWEGIDLKGEVLKCLVIVKLPFRSPSDPYCTAWEKHYLQQRMNSFEHFMLPDATIRLKQGVGRLIRSETDRGLVLVLDTRLIYKKYGQLMQNSLPLTNINAVSSAKLAEIIKPWF
ncbi:MAG TPA: helicase C-terminal domain-containing protein [Syntrophomonas sp.]|nr:helicase C-terminal domain-containing protein [Syntrophomonas sp.]HRW12994.1 helicase C-terminal domain-containing protein [Syntrophomonas sp.]